MSSWDDFQIVGELQEQNQNLLLQLDAKDRELREVQNYLSKIQTSEAREGKILELAKKNRALNVAIEREKSRVVRLQSEIENVKKTTSPRRSSKGAGKPASADVGLSQHLQISSREIASWKEKFSEASKRCAEVQAKADALKTERDRLLRVLQKEVGEDASLGKILEDGSDWRGRAQQIILLKNKVRELKKELGHSGANDTGRHELQYRKNLQKLEDTRRKEKDSLARELSETNEEYRSLRMKYDANLSRKKIVESENRDLRQKLGVLLTKTQNDDKLIEALKRELQFFREKSENVEIEKRSPKKTNKRVVTILGQDSTLKQQQEQILRQEKIIVSLTNRLRSGEGLVQGLSR
ncbi:coiled-coil domain-containing protein [Chloropicon roscoffensis]|uniref:Coiled-coil domain-containing protein n=1 Tax=Chloropicon roscoffensis TaxID=1461544 RepID=A0AAX4P298_9CHLO